METLLTTDTCALPAANALRPPPPPPPPSSAPPSLSARSRGQVAPLPPAPLRHSNALNNAALQPSIVGDAADGFPRSSRASSTRRSFFTGPTHASSSSSSSSASAPPVHQKTVIIVVNVLPLVFERNAADTAWDVEWSSSATSLFYRNLVASTGHFRPLFLGCPEVFIAKDEEAAVEKQLRGFDCVPVFLDPQVAHRYFQGFCKGVLWPVFHNVVDVYNSAKLALDEPKADAKKLQVDDTSSPPLSPAGAHKKATWCDPASWNPAAQDMCWGDYCSVNRTFARRVIETYHDGYMVWIHDYPFLMLPSYLLRKLRSAMIAMYLHVPFPSSEIFRCLAMRTEILRAMLCADHIGFLIFEHARHFLTSCKRLLGLNYKAGPNGMLEIEYNGRHVSLSCSHIEPDVTYLHTILDQHHTDRQDPAHVFRKRIEKFIYNPLTKQRKFVITSVDRLEGLSALPLKLRAFDRFLAMHPSKRGSVVLVQIGISLDSRPNDYHQTRDYVQRFVTEINRRYSTGPTEGDQVVYFEEKAKTTCAERMHLWRMSDAYLDTCVRFGLSLLPFEYLVAQRRNLEQKSDGDGTHQFGTMIVSEFASYSRILNGCVLVNPWKTDDIVNALVKATEMQYYEKLNRFQLNHKFLELGAHTRWAERLLVDFEALEQKKLQTTESRDTVEVGFGFDFRVMQFTSGFVKLDIDQVVTTSTRCSRRLFIFDYGGTLSWTTSILEEDGAARQFHQHSDTPRLNHELLRKSSSSAFGQEIIRYIDGQVRTSLSEEARENIRTLCEDPHNIVFVVSTGRRAELDAEFGSIPNLNLVADNGLFVKKSTQGRSAVVSPWECICEPGAMHMDWKADVRRVMQSFSSRTNGAFLIEGEASLLYDYRNSDPEYGEIQALELYDQLRQMVKKGEATIRRAKGFVEVHQFGVSKAVAVSLIVQHLKSHVGTPDFAFYAGDDESDESAIKALQDAFSGEVGSATQVYTCTVGMKPSNARFYVDSVTDILALVHAIAVRLRLESHRGGASSLLSSSYSDRFMSTDAPLVDIAFLHQLAADAFGGDELSSDLALAVSRASGSPRDSTTSATKSPSWSLSSWSSSEWLALGAGVAVGAVLATVGRPLVLGRSTRLTQWVAKQLQGVTDASL